MAQFSFTLIGMAQPMVIDVEANDLCELEHSMSHGKFVRGEILTSTGELVRLLLPVPRIQFIMEVSS